MLARLVWDPVSGMRAWVAESKWFAGLLVLVVCSTFAGAVVGARFDGSGKVLSERVSKDEAARVSEQDVVDRIQQAERLRLVAGVAQGLLGSPAAVVAAALFLRFLVWLWGRRLTWKSALSIVSGASLAYSVKALTTAAVALTRERLGPADLSALIPSALDQWMPLGLDGPWARLGAVPELFTVWAFVLMGFGLAHSLGVGLRRGLLFAATVFVFRAAIFVVALPGFMKEGRPS